MSGTCGVYAAAAMESSSGLVAIKSKFEADIRRVSLPIVDTFEEFYQRIVNVHGLKNVEVVMTYPDNDGELLPINNDQNFNRALRTIKKFLRVNIQRAETYRMNVSKPQMQRKPTRTILNLELTGVAKRTKQPDISPPADFRRVSCIMDVDILPETHRRVNLVKRGPEDKPLGFYLRDGKKVIRFLDDSLVKIDAIFISRIVSGGLADMSGLLAVNDEVIEVNGVNVEWKSLDQVTDMMVANSSNLIITIKPINQRNNYSKDKQDIKKLMDMLEQRYKAVDIFAVMGCDNESNDEDNDKVKEFADPDVDEKNADESNDEDNDKVKDFAYPDVDEKTSAKLNDEDYDEVKEFADPDVDEKNSGESDDEDNDVVKEITAPSSDTEN